MKTALFLAALFLSTALPVARAYEIMGGKPIAKLAEEQARAKKDKKLLCVVYKGADNTCPHCAAAADNGVKTVRASAVMVVITEAQVKDKTLLGTFPKILKDTLERQPTNAWVSFTVFDPDLTTIVASGDRSTLETDQKAIHAFGEKVRAARKELK